MSASRTRRALSRVTQDAPVKSTGRGNWRESKDEKARLEEPRKQTDTNPTGQRNGSWTGATTADGVERRTPDVEAIQPGRASPLWDGLARRQDRISPSSTSDPAREPLLCSVSSQPEGSRLLSCPKCQPECTSAVCCLTHVSPIPSHPIASHRILPSHHLQNLPYN